MIQITKEETQKIAQLARLELSDAEVERFSEDLSAVLSYIEQLNELDTDDVPVTAHITALTNMMRKDEIVPCAFREDLLAQVPMRDGDGVSVKAVFA